MGLATHEVQVVGPGRPRPGVAVLDIAREPIDAAGEATAGPQPSQIDRLVVGTELAPAPVQGIGVIEGPGTLGDGVEHRLALRALERPGARHAGFLPDGDEVDRRPSIRVELDENQAPLAPGIGTLAGSLEDEVALAVDDVGVSVVLDAAQAVRMLAQHDVGAFFDEEAAGLDEARPRVLEVFVAAVEEDDQVVDLGGALADVAHEVDGIEGIDATLGSFRQTELALGEGQHADPDSLDRSNVNLPGLAEVDSRAHGGDPVLPADADCIRKARRGVIHGVIVGETDEADSACHQSRDALLGNAQDRPALENAAGLGVEGALQVHDREVGGPQPVGQGAKQLAGVAAGKGLLVDSRRADIAADCDFYHSITPREAPCDGLRTGPPNCIISPGSAQRRGIGLFDEHELGPGMGQAGPIAHTRPRRTLAAPGEAFTRHG